MTVLVTGGSGFVGAAVVRALCDRGQAVRCMVRPASDRRNLAGLDVDLVEGDLRDPASLKAATRGISALYHVAADYRLWVPKPAEIYRNNVDGSRDIIRAAADAGAARIVYTSSVAVLGTHHDGRVSDEHTPVTLDDMIGHYKRSKFLAEQAVDDLVRTEQAPVVIVNPSTPIGPGDVRPTPTGRLILDAARGKMPAYVDTGLNIVHVDDVAAGHLLAFDKGVVGRRYILGGEDRLLGDLLAEIAALVGRRPPRVRLPHGLIMPIAYLADGWTRLTGGKDPMLTVEGVRMARKKMFFSSARAMAELGYQARPAPQAIAAAVDWFRATYDF